MSATTWDHRVTIGGVVTPEVEQVHAQFGARQPVGTCTLTVALPLPVNVVAGASVVVELAQDGVWWTDPIFVGTLLSPDQAIAEDGFTATLVGVGPCDRLSLPLQKDLVFAGGARTAAAALQTAPLHLGDDTISWYADTTPAGTSVSLVKTPGADTTFVWIAGLIHGSNSYEESIGDKTIKDHSRITIEQSSEEIGRGFLPVSSEDWTDELDYTNIANWDAFELYIAADIDDAVNITFKLQSGKKPGSSARDEYEVRDVTWQTAGKNSIRQIVRGLLKSGGIGTGGYRVPNVLDLDGNTIKLGGNGHVDAGQIRITATESRLSFAGELGDLFGYYLFDCPDGIIRMRSMRGVPTTAPAHTVTEGVDIYGVPRTGKDATRIYNDVLVEGASGTTASGKVFAYRSQTAEGDVLPHDLIPDPPGIKTLRVSSSLLTSNALCSIARQIREITAADVTVVDLAIDPVPMFPTAVFRVVSPSTGLATDFFAAAFSYDVDGNGYTMSLSGERGSGVTFAETEDPDEDEDDQEPIDPRPITEWEPYRPKAAVN